MPYDITRTELVWPGKYDEDGRRREVDRVSLPFQVIERVNESRASREVTKAKGMTLFDVWEGDGAETFEDGWRNKLIWGENLLVMTSLLNDFSGKVDLVYIDPPFATGADFTVSALVGDGGDELTKEQSVIEEKAYRDTWGRGQESYLQMMLDRLQLIHDLLRDGGSLYLHLDWRFVHDVKLVVDDVFGRGSFRNDITWKRAAILGRKATSGQYGRVTDTILYYTKGDSLTFNRPYALRPIDVAKFTWDDVEAKYFKTSPRGDYSDASIERLRQDNRVYTTKTGGIRIKYFLEKDDGGRWCERMPTDCLWLDIPDMMHIPDAEKTGYDTQKPEALLRRIVEASSNPGDLVLDVFSGSGTTAIAAERAGRRWIACDLGRYATHITRKRLLGIGGCKPFEVLNLGKYERKYWQVATFGEDLDNDGVISLYEYVAFILKLYHATPAAGMQHLHGTLGRAFVHVGAVDSPVTIDEIASCIEECVVLKAKELHILGWEWEMGLHDPMADEASARGVKLMLRQIPREVMEQQAAAKGDIEFFELAYLDVEVKPTHRKLEVGARLNNFVIPNPELVPEDVRDKIRKWSDYVDYWAVDWNFSEDTFHQGWVTYRTRKNRSLDLESDPHVYDRPGEYAVMIKVIDIFGNDTSKICNIKVG